MFDIKSGVIAAGLFTAIITGSALAQQQQASGMLSQPKSQLSNPVEQYLFGQQLYDYGNANSDVLSIIAAAGIVAKSTPRNVASPDPSGNGGASGTVTKPVANLPTLEDMLATAKTLAGQNKMLLAIIDDLASGASRGFIPADGGAKQWTIHKYANFGPFDFEGGNFAVVAVEAAAGLAPHIVVRDELNTTVCETDTYSKTAKDKDGHDIETFECAWLPIWKGTFTIEVSGSATKDIAYDMIMEK
jgi:hypothetical protein